MDKKVVELFAGVGGFRVGLNQVKSIKKNGRAIESNDWEFVWANQWEPSTSVQPAFNCYSKRFGENSNHVNEDICTISTADIPNHTLLVGGFPCQDYSVARSLSKEKGIDGKKGVLWWEIYRILKEKQPPFVLLENVDRLLKSPSKQRGRDFGIMLKSFSDLGYGVEWRVVNAADYGAAQRRRRIFIFAFKKDTNYYKSIENLDNAIYHTGLFAKTLPIEDSPRLNRIKYVEFNKNDDILQISNKFQENFFNSGIAYNGKILTIETTSKKQKPIKLKEILETGVISEKYFLNENQIEKHSYLKGSKRIERLRADGNSYFYSEGGMSFPDTLDSPGRTMLTSEGTINRSSHVIQDLETHKIRKITPIEAERLNHFPDNWTDTGMTDRQRYFMMGNALVTLIVKKIGIEISNIISREL